MTPIQSTFWINPMSKGNLGKTLAFEAAVSWLNRHGIPWSGANLDDRHTAFSDRYPELVSAHTLSGGLESKNELLKVFRRGLEGSAPVFVADTRAQVDLLIIEAMEGLQLFDAAAQAQTKLVFWIIPFDDDEHTRNLIELVQFAQEDARWIVVKNPTRAACRTYEKSGLQRALLKLGAKEIDLPGITPVTMLALERLSIKAGRELSLAEAAQDERVPLLNRGEVQWFLQGVYSQLDAVAEHLLPPAQAATIQAAAAEGKKARAKKTADLMADYGSGEEG